MFNNKIKEDELNQTRHPIKYKSSCFHRRFTLEVMLKFWATGTNMARVLKIITSVNKPLGGECGKSWDNNNFMRKTPFSYGVPAARSRMLIELEGLNNFSKGLYLMRTKLHAWAFNISIYGRKIIIVNAYFDTLRGRFIKILQFLCKLLNNIWWKIFISRLKRERERERENTTKNKK
jgi:hypothetical protein